MITANPIRLVIMSTKQPLGFDDARYLVLIEGNLLTNKEAVAFFNDNAMGL